MIFPDKFCLWDDKPKKALRFLGLNALPDNLYERSTLTDQEYLKCVDYLNLIKNERSKFGIQDFISLDVFFWQVFDDVMSKQD